MADLLQRAERLLTANTQTALSNGRLYRFTVPSVRHYPFQWFWDSCFHAIVWAKIDVERAKDELRALFARQQPDGLIPHVIFWDQSKLSRRSWHYLESKGSWRYFDPRYRPLTSAEIQPPVLAQAVEAVCAVDASFEAEALPVLERYYRYLARCRTRPGRHLISLISQFESGLDYSPAYDELAGIDRRRPISIFARSRLVQLKNLRADYNLNEIFRRNDSVEDILVNSIYIDALRTLGRLAQHEGRHAALAAWARQEAACAREQLLELWDPGRHFFYNRNSNGRPVGAMTVHGLMPLLLEDLPADMVAGLLEHLHDPKRFAASYPVPSVALDEPSFLIDSHLYGFRFIWRGPASLNTNWLVTKGLRRHGQRETATLIADSSVGMVEAGGFNEFFNALTSDPTGEPDFGWATLAADIHDCR